jgi:hypothetical protein
VLFKFYKELGMTTAFELGCLSAMEKVAVNSGGGDPNGRRSAWRPGERSGFNDAVNFMGNVIGEVPSVAGGYLNAAGNAIGDTIGLGYGPTVQSNKDSYLISPAPTKAALNAAQVAKVRREIAAHDAQMNSRIAGSPVLRPSEQHLAGP